MSKINKIATKMRSAESMANCVLTRHAEINYSKISFSCLILVIEQSHKLRNSNRKELHGMLH